MKFIADLHIHSHYSIATSKDCNPENLYKWACLKGITVVGTGDFTHPGWFSELKDKLEPAEDGLYKLKPEFVENVIADIPQSCQNPVRFILSSEISSIYKKYEKTRKIHNLLLMPNFEDVEKFSQKLDKIGNIRSDGRPILGLDSYRLLEIALESSEDLSFIPAHIWTPHFSLFGANSGFDKIEECYEDLSSVIFAMETGLSSDPAMNWRLSALDDYTLVSHSDAHSPRKLGREANLFDTELSYYDMQNALKDPKKGFFGTLEFYPEEGKYHYDGHRKCGICWKPSETRKHNQICPVCGKKVTIGVLHRVEELADRPEGAKPESALPYQNLVPLPEIISAAVGVGVNTKTVYKEYINILSSLGPEFNALRETPIDEIALVAGTLIAEGVKRVRENKIEWRPGFDGEYGEVKIISPEDETHYKGQEALFDLKQNKEIEKSKTTKSNAKSLKNKQDNQLIEEHPTLSESSQENINTKIKHESRVDSSVSSSGTNLNKQQQKCVEAEDGPIIIVAGPGTGKTRTLVYRIVHLIQEKSILPENILGVTFTNKAADEMLSRVKDLTSENIQLNGLTIGTFHTVCLNILKAQEKFKNYTIFDSLDSQELLRQVLKDQNIKGSPNKFLEKISFAKSRDNLSMLKQSEDFFDVYEEYQKRLTNFKAFDYDDILIETVRIFENDNSLLQNYREKFQHILVDEFQDVNAVQYKLTKMLADKGENLFVIGDPDQSIYGFRGADYRYFFQLQKDFPGSKIFKLERNYRSTNNIVNAASQVISRNPDRISIVLETIRENGQKVRLIETGSELAEGIAIVQEIGRMVGGATMLQSDGQPFERTLGKEDEERSFSDFAVLFRTGNQADILEECFLKEGIPYRLLGQKSFLEDKDVRKLLSFFRIVISEDDDFRFLNYLQISDIDLKDIWLSRIRSLAESENISLQKALRKILEKYSGNLSLSKLSELQDMIDRYRQKANSESVENLFKQWFDEMDLQPNQNMTKFLRIVDNFESLNKCMEKIVLYRGADYGVENENKLEAVSLMTLHAAKGLEFPVVFITGVEEGVIPYQKEDSDINEERRLFYVGLTRAMDECILLSTRRRKKYGKTVQNEISSFVNDIPEQVLQTKEIIKKRKKPEATQLELF